MTSFHVDDVRTDLAIIRVVGRLNMVTAPDLRDVVAHAVKSGKSRLVVDLAGVEFMDSSGLGALIGALKTTRQARGRSSDRRTRRTGGDGPPAVQRRPDSQAVREC